MKVNLIVGSSIVIESAIKKEDFEKIKGIAPELLKAKDEDGNVCFVVKYTENGDGLIGNNAIVFNSIRNECLALSIPAHDLTNENAEEFKKGMKDKFGMGFVMLKEIEESIAEAMDGINEQMAGLNNMFAII